MRVIIAGSRDFNDYNILHIKVNEIFALLSKEGHLTGSVNKDVKQIEIISGGAKGADKLGEKFAKEYNTRLSKFIPDWKMYGKYYAGFLRNEDMAEYAQREFGVLIAFWDGESRGTKHMIRTAKLRKLRVFVYNYITGEMEDFKND